MTLRINTSLVAYKKKKNHPDTNISIDSMDLTTENGAASYEFRYYVKAEKIQ